MTREKLAVELTLKEKVKIWAVRVLFVSAIVSGYAVRPTIDRTVAFTEDLFFPAPKAFVQPLSAHDAAVKADFENPEHVAQCKAASEQRVYTQEAREANLKAQDAFANAAKAELAANRGADYESLFTNDSNAAAGKATRDANKAFKASTTK